MLYYRTNLIILIILGLITALNLCSLLYGDQPGSFEFAKKMYEDGFYQEAKLVFERIIAVAPTTPEAEESFYLLAEINRNSENYAAAENYYRTLYETFPAGRFREQALYNWSISQQKQGKYSEALETANRFVQTFPASTKRVEALYILVECHYNLTNFSRVLSIGKELLDEYPTHTRVPDIMLLIARSYLNLNEYNDGENYLSMIIQRFPNSDARWESVLIRVELLRERVDLQTAIAEITSQLAVSLIPRVYEEKLRKKLADYYLIDNRRESALEQLNELINKFDRSNDLTKYLYLSSEILIDLRNYELIISYYERFERDVQETAYQFDFLVKVVEAFFRKGQVDKSEDLVRQIEALRSIGVEPDEPDNTFALSFWKARIKEHKGLFMDAINDYRYILTAIPSYSPWRYRILMQMGDIYFEKLNKYSTAINYYNQIITGINVDPVQFSLAMYKQALCYQAQGEYRKALNILQQINRSYLEGDIDVTSVNNMIELLRRFKIIDFEQTTSKLLFSLIDYIDDEDRDNLKNRLIDIAVYDLKDMDSVIHLLSDDNTATGLYMRGKAYILAIERSILEKSEKKDKLTALQGIIAQLISLAENDSSVRPKLDELLIEKQYLDNNLQATSGLVAEIESFINDYPNSSAVNRFSFLAGNHYLHERIFVRADEFLHRTTLSADIPLNDYEYANLAMASYFFENEQYGRAVSYYQNVDYSVSRPDNMYKYAISLINTNQTRRGVELLDHLIKINADFEGVEVAIQVLAEHYQSESNYTGIVNTMILLPETRRGPDFYKVLSDAYLQLGDKINAKESLMYIEEKDNEILRLLAELHFLTGDLIMAEYTYLELTESERDKEHLQAAYSMLGHINYNRENWQAAVRNYDKVINDIGNRTVLGNLTVTQIAKETIISLYRINNRPRAESVTKSFQKALSGDSEVTAKIQLNEAIYQMTINRNRADRAFNSIIRNSDFSPAVKYEAYFWKGLNNLENQKADDAYQDFKQAANSSDLHLRNQALLKLGTISFSKEQFQQSLDYYYTVIRDDKTGLLALDAAKNFAIVCKTIEEWQKAINAYNIILEKGGEGKLEGETIFNIAYCQFRDRQYNDAIPMFERAITLLDDREMKAEAQFWIGESYANLGQYDRAATEYLKVGYYYPDMVQFVATAEIKLSDAYIKQGRIEAAKGVLERIINKYGRTSDWGRQAVIILQGL